MFELPKCQKCGEGVLVPLSDYGEDGATVLFKAWACTRAPACRFQLRVDKGVVSYGDTEEYHNKREEQRKRAS